MMPTIINNEEYYTAGEAADYLEVSAKTFIKFQRDYHLKAISRPGEGNRKYFKKSDLEPIRQYRPVERDGDEK